MNLPKAIEIVNDLLYDSPTLPPDHPRALKPLRNAHPDRELTRCVQASPPFPRVAKLVAGTAKFRGFTAFGLKLSSGFLAMPRSYLTGYIKLWGILGNYKRG